MFGTSVIRLDRNAHASPFFNSGSSKLMILFKSIIVIQPKHTLTIGSLTSQTDGLHHYSTGNDNITIKLMILIVLHMIHITDS